MENPCRKSQSQPYREGLGKHEKLSVECSFSQIGKPQPSWLAGLKNGIKKFWKTLTPTICCKYINHIHKVMPIVIENRGEASGD